jgi:hypothetical protein
MKTKQYSYTDYLCEDCETELHTKQGHPYAEKDGNFYCYDCAVKRKIISPMEGVSVGCDFYNKAEYDAEHDVIIAYRKWGRGYMKDLYPLGEGWK